MSFLKQEPPNPTLTSRKRLPMRPSSPTARDTSTTSAAVLSHSAEMELMEEIRCARKAFAASFDSSALHTLLVMIFSRGTQFA